MNPLVNNRKQAVTMDWPLTGVTFLNPTVQLIKDHFPRQPAAVTKAARYKERHLKETQETRHLVLCQYHLFFLPIDVC